MTSGSLYRLSAFSTCPQGGNPAGVWIGDTLPSIKVMQQMAADVGFSETAFVAPGIGRDRTIRYYSPEMEVSFCGHATIATGVVLGEIEGDGTYRLATAIGEVPVTVRLRDGYREASLTSVEPKAYPCARFARQRRALCTRMEIRGSGWFNSSCQSLCRSVAPCIGRC